MNRYFGFFLLLILVVGFIWPSGFRFSGEKAIRAAFDISEDIHIVSSVPIENGKAVSFEYAGGLFGVAKLVKRFGFMWEAQGGSYGEMVKEREPFKATGFSSTDWFVVGVKIADSRINYISIGNDIPNLTPTTSYSLTLNEVKKLPTVYRIAEVKNSYATFFINQYLNDNFWTVRAFDQQGKLIADKLAGGEVRYMN